MLHERHTTLQVKGQGFDCCSTFYSHSSAFDNERITHTKTSVKRTIACSWTLLCIFELDKRYIWTFLSFLVLFGIVFPTCRFINKKTKYGWSNLTNTVIIVVDITLRGYKYRQEPVTIIARSSYDCYRPCGSHQVNSKKTGQLNVGWMF